MSAPKEVVHPNADGTIPSVSLLELRKWYAANKDSEECRLALKQKGVMQPGVYDELKKRAPGETDEERELALLFSLTQVAEKLELHAVLLAGVTAEMIPPPPAKVSRVDVTPLEAPPADGGRDRALGALLGEPPTPVVTISDVRESTPPKKK